MPSLLQLSVPGLICSLLLGSGVPSRAQSTDQSQQIEQLQQTVELLENRVAALEREVNARQSAGAPPPAESAAEAAANLSTAERALQPRAAPAGAAAPAVTQAAAHPAAPPRAFLPDGATLNFYLDGYYEYNFNHPIGQVNELRAYDVTSNSFSINQADLMFDLEPQNQAAHRIGGRMDLMFGQATETLQGSPGNELRPQVWRNLYQAYGSYEFPVGSGLRADFGKFASVLGAEGNYTKDQINYTRSFMFEFLPFYHMGFRSTYNLGQKATITAWLVNGAQQTEDFNGFKSIGVITTFKLAKSLTWNLNYYTGQEQRAVVANTGTTLPPLPIQPGQPLSNVTPALNGREHIFDTYSTWNMSSKWTAVGEADYVISRQSSESAPAHADDGVFYLKYQWNPKLYLAGRAEYVADPDSFFSTASQDLKEGTATMQYRFSRGFAAYMEYRRDWSNRRFFLTSTSGLLSGHQSTAALGLVWWYGGDQNSW